MFQRISLLFLLSACSIVNQGVERAPSIGDETEYDETHYVSIGRESYWVFGKKGAWLGYPADLSGVIPPSPLKYFKTSDGVDCV